MDEGVVKCQEGLGLSTTREEREVLVSAGRMVSDREDDGAGESGKMMWGADIGGEEWRAKCGVVMLRGADGRVAARSVDKGEELWSLEAPADMRWDNKSMRRRASREAAGRTASPWSFTRSRGFSFTGERGLTEPGD